jgi:hypothetical protein
MELLKLQGSIHNLFNLLARLFLGGLMDGVLITGVQ